MHSQARAFLQPTRANIHQYQFNNPITLNVCIVNTFCCIQGVFFLYNEFMYAGFFLTCWQPYSVSFVQLMVIEESEHPSSDKHSIQWCSPSVSSEGHLLALFNIFHVASHYSIGESSQRTTEPFRWTHHMFITVQPDLHLAKYEYSCLTWFIWNFDK